jgi:three-Cys-motif partner protein
MVSRSDLALYEGREQSFVKHELLTAYLERFMMILGQHFPRVLFVDCFAGPWMSQSTDFSDTSFGRAIQIIRGCQQKLETTFGRKPQFRALFVEKDPAAFAKLQRFAAEACTPRLEVVAWSGEFQDQVEKIARWIGPDFAFVLIDPKGYKEVIAPSTLAPLLSMRNVEALVNYMWQFLSLAVGHLDKSSHYQNLVAVFGEDVRSAPEAGAPDRESWLLDLYRRRLVAASKPTGEGRTRTVSFPIEYPGRTTTKYFLIHVTHNDVGVIKFAEASKDVAVTQNSVRFGLIQQNKERKTGIPDLFGESEIDLAIGQRELTEPWLELLPSVGCEVQVGEPEMARLIERYNCFIPELQKGLMALIKSGRIQNLDMQRQRSKNAVLYEKRERLRRVR